MADPTPTDDLIVTLDNYLSAYPADIFPDPPEDQRTEALGRRLRSASGGGAGLAGMPGRTAPVGGCSGRSPHRDRTATGRPRRHQRRHLRSIQPSRPSPHPNNIPVGGHR